MDTKGVGMKLLFIFILVSFSLWAKDNDLTHRPEGFAYANSRAVFVDFEEANYEIIYDLNAKNAVVKALIRFRMIEEGYPVFDLIQDPSLTKLDNLPVSTKVIPTPHYETSLRVIEMILSPGEYQLSVTVPLLKLVSITDEGVKSAFWVTDLDDRSYLEQYIPVNLEFDRVKMKFNLFFNGLKNEQHVFANGHISRNLKEKSISIDFPEYYTVNSLYFHTTPVDSIELLETTFSSIDGRTIPIYIYMAKTTSANETLGAFKQKTIEVLNELEADYGPFPHQKVIIYNANLSDMGLGGMEYAGATVTDKYSLPHELFHSYFGRGVTPANGNAGWIDEALASWRDNGYNRTSTLSGSSIMASHAYYTRKTDTAAYSFGARFMAYLDGKFSHKGGLKPFMIRLLETKIFTPIFTEDFIQEMEVFYGEKIESVFKKYVYGIKDEKVIRRNHSIHKKLGIKELERIL